MKNADQARDDSMEEILASIRKIIADEEVSSAPPLDPRAPIAEPMTLDAESLDAALGREPFFEALQQTLGPAPAPLAPAQVYTPAADADILELSEDFLVPEGQDAATPPPFQNQPRPALPTTPERRAPELRAEPRPDLRSAPRPTDSFRTEPRLERGGAVSKPPGGVEIEPSNPLNEQPDIQLSALDHGERRLWDGQPPIPLRPRAQQAGQRAAPSQAAPGPSATPPFPSQTTDFRKRPSAIQTAGRPTQRPAWSGPREVTRDPQPISRAPGGANGSAPEPLWPEADAEERAAPDTQQTRAPHAPAKPSPSLGREAAPAQTSRLSAPVTQNGSPATTMPNLGHLEKSSSPGGQDDGTSLHPEYFQNMAEEFMRATITGMGDQELKKASEKSIAGARPALAAVAESFAGMMSVEAAAQAAAQAAAEKPKDREHLQPRQTDAARGDFGQSDVVRPHASFEDGFKQLLKPMLTEWLNENMPRLLESAIDRELKRRMGETE
jgi:hypothetical protein